ncbi:MAG: MFS transporter [Thermomicrobiales bacterium]
MTGRPAVQATVPPIAPDLDTHHLGGLFATGESTDLPEIVPSSIGTRIRRPARSVRAADQPSVMADPDFRTLWLSRLMVQTAQGALLYALLIMVVDLSNRSLYNSLFVICSNIPSIVFGLAAGVVVDSISRKALMVLLNGFRFAFMLFLVGSQASLAGVFAATLGIWIIHQFYSPAESSMLAETVPPARYTSAQAMFNLALTISQAIGLVIAAPILLKIDGPRLVFAFSGALFLIAGSLVATLPPARERIGAVMSRPNRSLRASLGDGWRFIQRDRQTFEAVVDDVLVSVGMSALIVILPFYLERVLGTSKENTVFVFAPAALGLVIGLRLAPTLGRSIGEQFTATMGLFVFAVCVAALGFINATYLFLDDTLNLPLDDITNLLRIPPLVAMAMIVSVPAGFASAIVNVAARSILLRRTPGTLRGQVIATQGLIGNIGSLLPTLIAGIAMDIFGVTPIAIAIAVCIAGLATVAHSYGKRSVRAPVPALN